MHNMALTEAVYYILLSLVESKHGYGIMQNVEMLSGGRVKLAAGTLYGIYNGFDDEEILRFATLAAACSLFAENSTDGMLSKNEIYALEQKYGRKDF